VDPRAGLDDLENRKFLTLPGLELRPLSHPARSQSLYRLRNFREANISIKFMDSISVLWTTRNNRPGGSILNSVMLIILHRDSTELVSPIYNEILRPGR
jgi:hypothetical protein